MRINEKNELSCSKQDVDGSGIEDKIRNIWKKGQNRINIPTYCVSPGIPQNPLLFMQPKIKMVFNIPNCQLNINNLQSESDFCNMIERINNLASKRSISLRIFNKLLAPKYQNSPVLKIAFAEATSNLIRLIKKTDYPRYVKNNAHLQQMIDGRFYKSKGEKGFEKLADQVKIKYGGIIYILRCKSPFFVDKKLIELIYIGCTWKTLKQRFIDHVSDAIYSYMEIDGMPNRYIERVILHSLEDLLLKKYEIIPEINVLKEHIREFINPLEDWEIRKVIKEISLELYDQYFEMDVLEVHRNFETTLPREVFHIRNYSRLVNGECVKGTLFPNGLNMIDFPYGNRRISLPLYDIVIAISLGFIGPEINEMLESLYNINIDCRQIYTKIRKFWRSWDNVLEKFFKPILQHLLERKFKWDDITHTLRRHPSFRLKRNFQNWFYGLNVTQLKSAIRRDGFSWDNLKEIASEIFEQLSDENKIKGVSKDHWIEWFVTNKGMEVIAAELDYRNAAAFRSSWIKKDRVSIFQKVFAFSNTSAVRKYRRIRTLHLLTDKDFVETSLGSRLYWIYVNVFRLTRWEDLAVPRPSQGLRNCREFFNKLFKKERLTFDQLESIGPSDSELFKKFLKI